MSINVELRGGPLDGTRGAVPEPKPVYYGETTLGTSPARYYGNHDLNDKTYARPLRAALG
jgi:hypothetical protein